MSATKDWSGLLLFLGERMDNVGLAAVMFLAGLFVVGVPILLVWLIFG